MFKPKPKASASNSPLFVSDIDTATCMFFPHGTQLAVGERLAIYDEKTVFNRKPRERLVEVKAIKIFRSTGRQITLDLEMISEDESKKIAADSHLDVSILLNHRAGTEYFDHKRPPVVVYFTGSN